jgi:hypothetical protein
MPLSSPLRLPLRLGLTALAARRGGGAPAFDPATLFASGELGAWYDRQDTGAMFSEIQPTSQVSAGASCQLALDKKSGSLYAADQSIVSSWTFSSNANQNIITSASGYYRIRFTASGLSSTCRVRLQSQNPAITTDFVSLDGNYEYVMFAGSGYLRFGSSVSAAGTGVLTGITCEPFAGNASVQSSASLRPLFQVSPPRLVFDGTDDVHVITFSSSLGSNCTVARSVPGVGASILTGQTIGTTYNVTETDSGLVIVNRALTTEESDGLTSYLEAAAFF